MEAGQGQGRRRHPRRREGLRWIGRFAELDPDPERRCRPRRWPAFGATEAVGDDRLQQQAGRRVNPDSFTHGTSEQRREWFETGYGSGETAACDTFSADAV